MRVGIYNRWLETMGGGEQHLGAIAQSLAPTHQVELIAHARVNIAELERRLGLNLTGVTMRVVPDTPRFAGIAEASADYDLFLNASHLDYFPARGRQNALLVYFPAASIGHAQALNTYNRAKRLAVQTVVRLTGSHGRQILRKVVFGSGGRSSDQSMFGRVALGTFRAVTDNSQQEKILNSYQLILTNSAFTQRWIRRYWNRESFVLFPPVNIDQFAPGIKGSCILSVGRFFAGNHNKKHVEMIRAFRSTTHGALATWEYHLAGGFVSTESNAAYLAAVQKEASADPRIHLHVNCSLTELRQLYAQSKLFWHAAGFGEDEEAHPERFEHFGITTVEAMAAGCVPLAVSKGGQPEIIRSPDEGILWTTLSQLVEQSEILATDDGRREQVAQAALARAQDFGPWAFEERLACALEQLGISGVARAGH